MYGQRQEFLKTEEGAVRKITAQVKIALAYPNTYQIASSSLGWQLIYALINEREDSLCERVFLTSEPIKKSPLSSLESNIPLNRFDIAAFSVSFEDDYSNILRILEMGGIEPQKSKRSDKSPLVIMGGVCASMNPEPLADFIDLFVLGEGEEVMGEFIDAYKEGILAGEGRRELLKRLAKIPGIYVPQFYDIQYKQDGTIARIEPKAEAPAKLEARFIKDLNKWRGESQFFTPHTEFKDTHLIEVSRGCARGCRFCLLGTMCRPFRIRKLCTLKDMIEKASRAGRKIGLLGAAVSDYPQIGQLCDYLEEEGLTFGISSLRADSITDKMAMALLKSGQRSFTIAPEAGSEKMREFIDKKLNEKQILNAAECAASCGFGSIKLYFMIGLPNEDEEDIQAIIDLTLKIKEILLKHARPRGKMGDVIVSVSNFVPKPRTPFQRYPMDATAQLKNKQQILRKGLSRAGNIKLLCESVRDSYIQGLLSRGDRKLGGLLIEMNKLGNWKRAIAESGINPDFYLYREIPSDEILPWEI